jgi:hypothetical protein
MLVVLVLITGQRGVRLPASVVLPKFEATYLRLDMA